MVCDLDASSWTPLNGYYTGCGMTTSTAGEPYAYRRSPLIEEYDPGTDSWTYVMAAPPGTTGSYCNLAITRDGQFLYTESDGSAVHLTWGGTWHTFSLPFITYLMGDDDPSTHQYVIGQSQTNQVQLIDLTTWTITDFLLGPFPKPDYGRLSSVMGSRYYYDCNGTIYLYDLSDLVLPPRVHGISLVPGTSSDVDRAHQRIFVTQWVMDPDGTLLSVFDPIAGTLTGLDPPGPLLYSTFSLAFSAPSDAHAVFSDGFESGDTSAWSATVP